MTGNYTSVTSNEKPKLDETNSEQLIDDEEKIEIDNELDEDKNPGMDLLISLTDQFLVLHTHRECYICKAKYWEVHEFYDKVFQIFGK